MVVDLTYPFHKGMFKYPSDPEVKIDINLAYTEEIPELIYDESGLSSGVGVTIEKCKSGYANLNIRNHHGTHVDAPAHKIAGGKTIDKYPIEKFVNELGFINLRKEGLMRRSKYIVGLRDVEIGLSQLDCNNLGALVIYTGFCDIWGNNSSELSDKNLFEKNFPYFSQDAAQYITNSCANLNIIGIDSFSVDPSGSNSEVHKIFFEKDILPLETLTNLDSLDKYQRFPPKLELVSVPLSYERADAAQTRAYVQEIKNG